MERKGHLSRLVIENGRIAVSCYIEEQGVAFYQVAEERQLEGVVAKRKNSLYLLPYRHICPVPCISSYSLCWYCLPRF